MVWSGESLSQFWSGRVWACCQPHGSQLSSRQMVWPPLLPDMSIYETYWRSLLTDKILQLQISESCGHLWKQHGSKSPEVFHQFTKLLHLINLERDLHSTRHVSHDFWRISVYRNCDCRKWKQWLICKHDCIVQRNLKFLMKLLILRITR